MSERSLNQFYNVWLGFRHYVLENKWSQLLEMTNRNCYLNVVIPFSLPKDPFYSCSKCVLCFVDLSVPWFFKGTVYANQERDLCSLVRWRSASQKVFELFSLNLYWAYVCRVTCYGNSLLYNRVKKKITYSLLVILMLIFMLSVVHCYSAHTQKWLLIMTGVPQSTVSDKQSNMSYSLQAHT